VTGESGFDEDASVQLTARSTSFAAPVRQRGAYEVTDASAMPAQVAANPQPPSGKGREKDVAHKAELFTASQPARPPPQTHRYAGIFRNGERRIRTADTTIFRGPGRRGVRCPFAGAS
jgi:hypothetical protein